MTENDAKSKWCPLARMDENNSNRRYVDGTCEQDPKCIASECACWVWEGNESYFTGHCGLTR